MPCGGLVTAKLLLSHFSRVRLCAIPQTAAHQAPRPWDSPGKNTGMGCHFLLQCMKVKSESEVAQSCPTLSWTAAYQAPPSMGFPRQEYWSWVPSSHVQLFVTPQPARLLCPGNSPGKTTGVGCPSVLQGIFLIQESNAGLPHCRQITVEDLQAQPKKFNNNKIVFIKRKSHKSNRLSCMLSSFLLGAICFLQLPGPTTLTSQLKGEREPCQVMTYPLRGNGRTCCHFNGIRVWQCWPLLFFLKILERKKRLGGFQRRD